MDPLAVFRSRAAVLVDLDGTLYTPADYPAYFDEMDRVTGRRVREALGAADDRDAFERLVREQRRLGLGSKSATLDRVLGIGLAEMNRFREAETHPERHLRPDPRAHETLVALRRRFRLVLGTNNAPGLARRLLGALGIPGGIFDFVLSSEDLLVAKPEPAFFHAVAERMGLPPDAFVSVGDSEASDLAPARELGMGSYLVTTMEDFYRLALAER